MHRYTEWEQKVSKKCINTDKYTEIMNKNTDKTDTKKIQINNKNSEFSDNLVVGTKARY